MDYVEFLVKNCLGYRPGQGRGWPDVSKLPHNDERTWYLPKVDRATAEEYLKGKPHGTFLVRRATPGTAHSHTLSIVNHGIVTHCKIFESDRGRFGFAEPYNIYPNLMALVLHYSQDSLEQFNPHLKTQLSFPVFQCKTWTARGNFFKIELTVTTRQNMKNVECWCKRKVCSIHAWCAQ